MAFVLQDVIKEFEESCCLKPLKIKQERKGKGRESLDEK